MDDRSQWMFLGDRGEERFQCHSLGYVASCDLDLCSQLFELCSQLLCSLCLFSPAADQEQLAGALACQVAGHQSAEGAEAAGDEDGALGVEWLRSLLFLARLCPGQAGDPARSLTQGDLGLTCS